MVVGHWSSAVGRQSLSADAEVNEIVAEAFGLHFFTICGGDVEPKGLRYNTKDGLPRSLRSLAMTQGGRCNTV